jgi:hypothetical protein
MLVRGLLLKSRERRLCGLENEGAAIATGVSSAQRPLEGYSKVAWRSTVQGRAVGGSWSRRGDVGRWSGGVYDIFERDMHWNETPGKGSNVTLKLQV